LTDRHHWNAQLSTVCIDFAMLQELYQPSDRTSAVVLPANEFLDERCFDDERTAAGAFIRKHFSSQESNALRDLVHRELAQHNYESVATDKGITKKSYDIGTCVYLEQPLGHRVRIIFAAIASDREPRGLRADLSTIFKAVEEIKVQNRQSATGNSFRAAVGIR
jgi:hypothetical protein